MWSNAVAARAHAQGPDRIFNMFRLISYNLRFAALSN
jgi:hypothetical protein